MRVSRLEVYDPDEPLVFLHVPKTAGTSLFQLLQQWFPDRLLPHYRRDGRDPDRYTLGGGMVVAGHFNRLRGLGVRAYYPHARQFLTVLRNPFDRFVSQWLYLRARRSPLLDAAGVEQDFIAWFEWRVGITATGQDSFATQAQLPCDMQDFGPGFIAVGVTERLEETLRVFAHRLGCTAPATSPHLNRTNVDASPYEPWRRRHRRVFESEYVLYEQALRMLDEGLADLR